MERVGLGAVDRHSECVGPARGDGSHLAVDDETSSAVGDRPTGQAERAVGASAFELLLKLRPRRAVHDLLGRDRPLVGGVGSEPGFDEPGVRVKHLPLDAVGLLALTRGDGEDLRTEHRVVVESEALHRVGRVADSIGVHGVAVAVAADAVTDELHRSRPGGTGHRLLERDERRDADELLEAVVAPVTVDHVRRELRGGGDVGRERAPLGGLALDDRARCSSGGACADLDCGAGHRRGDAYVVDDGVRVSTREPHLGGHGADRADVPGR